MRSRELTEEVVIEMPPLPKKRPAFNPTVPYVYFFKQINHIHMSFFFNFLDRYI